MSKKLRSNSVDSEASFPTRGVKRENSGSNTEAKRPVKSPRVSKTPEWSDIYSELIQSRGKLLHTTVADHFMEVSRKLNRSMLIKIVSRIESCYYSNSYHNFQHACHVTLNCAFMLKQLIPELSVIEKLSLLYAALIHDIEHLGVPNVTLINDMHPLAKKFHDQSVAEMNSLTVGLGLLEEFNLLESFGDEDRATFRRNVIDIVLCTDVADTYKKRLMYFRIDDLSQEETGLNTSSPAGRLMLLCLLMRTCDISSGMQSHETFKAWAKNFYLEITLASKDPLEKIRSDKIKYYNTQISFMEAHSLALVVRLQSAQAVKPEFTDMLVQNFQSNLSFWRENGMDMLNEWIVESAENFKKYKGSTVYDSDWLRIKDFKELDAETHPLY
eukprot:gene30085-36336_t